ncbi:MAG: cupin domain-containing protein [Acidobacteriota bacterium]
MSDAIDLAEKLRQFDDLWSPRVIAEMNDVQFKLAKIRGTFVWHDHAETDEVFFVVNGSMAIEFRDRAPVRLQAGQLFVVPKGVEHRPVAEEECHILLVEPRGVVNTGAADSELQAENDVWI